MKKAILYMMTVLFAAGGYGADWPVWRGPNDNGISSETGWSLKGASVCWTKELGVGRLIVLNENGTLHEVAVSPEKYNGLATLDTGAGKLCWTPPVLANGIIYCRNDKGTLVAVDVRK